MQSNYYSVRYAGLWRLYGILLFTSSDTLAGASTTFDWALRQIGKRSLRGQPSLTRQLELTAIRIARI